MTATRFLLVGVTVATGCGGPSANDTVSADERSRPEEVVFWHFWGGRDLPVVRDVVERFNASQSRYRVREIAMPGANLDLKLFLSIAGGDPPDLMNHDDPVVADWAHRGALTPLDAVAGNDEIERLRGWLYPAARDLGSYDGRMYALVNGLDIRALYFNKSALREAGLGEIAERGPQTLDELDRIAETIAPPGEALRRVGYLPDPRRLWAWGVVFGGEFSGGETPPQGPAITGDDPRIVAALRWMAGYRDRYGADRLAAFRSGDQALTGAAFPLLSDRRYAVMMDGQWRVRDLAEAAEAAARDGREADQFGVCPLPPPPGGVARAGWVNANFFVIPHGAGRPRGAWEFMKFWAGFGGAEHEAAQTAAAGGWIPAGPTVVADPRFQRLLSERPLFAEFVRLAASPNQHPTPSLPVAATYYREVVAAAQDVLYRGADPDERLRQAVERTRRRLADVLADGRRDQGGAL